MAVDLAGREDLDVRSASPPGRESREEWWPGGDGAEPSKNGRPLLERLGQRKEQSRSRSRSPLKKDGKGRGEYSPTREIRYSREGTNTLSKEPHLERARLFVGNIEPNRTHRTDIARLFSQYGEVMGVSVHKGYAFVQMDRERTANKAVNYQDNQMFMNSKIHVEFSQAAVKAGAKFERLPSRSPPPREREFHPPPYKERDPQPHTPDMYLVEEQEKQREERLARILQMEREIAMLRAKEGGVTRNNRRSPPPSLNSQGYDSYSRDRDPPFRGDRDPPYRGDRDPPYRGDRDPPYRGGNSDRGGVSSGRGYYNRQSPELSRGSSGNGYRDAISYPSQYTGGGSSSGGSNFSRSTAAVGYGSAGSGGSGKNNAAPPGWPSGGQDKSNANRPPFTNNGPWS